MTSFLFWNINRKPLQKIIADLAFQFEVDVLMLTECSIAPAILLRTLNQSGESRYHYAPSICNRIQMFTRFTDKFIRPIFEADRLTIRHLNLQGRIDILLAVIHFHSKLYWSSESQAFECIELANSIRIAEEQIGHSRTILVGDLNMNPFEDGVVSSNGLNAVMSRIIAGRMTRVVHAKEWPFFYNPMWSLLGDASPGPPGTYYYSGSEPKLYFWNMFDQVLIRPDLLDLFSNQDLKILETDGKMSFLSSTRTPDAKIASDHLPIFFTLNL